MIVHLAAYKIPRYGDAYETLMINGFGSEVVAQTAARTGAKIVAASTSDVYGKNPQVPFSEEMDSVIGNPHVKRWAYAISKMFEEQLLLACHERFGDRRRAAAFLRRLRPEPEPDLVGRPAGGLHREGLDSEPLPLHGDGQPDALLHVRQRPRRRHRRRHREFTRPTISSSTSAPCKRSRSAGSPSSSGSSCTATTDRLRSS